MAYPLLDLCVEEAYPGDPSTSYTVKVKAAWVENMHCSKALDILITALWNSTTIDIRKKVFAITIHDKRDVFHCEQEMGDQRTRRAS